MYLRYPIFPLLFSCFLLCFLCDTLYAQKTDRFIVAYDDSVVLKEGTRLFGSSLKFSNPNDQDIAVGIRLSIPQNWKPLVKNDDEAYSSVILKKGEPFIIPLNLLPRRRTVAIWDSVDITVWQAFTTDTFHYSVHFKMEAKPNYTIEPLNENQSFYNEKPDVVLFKYLVTNTGNIADAYTVKCQHELLRINYSAKFRLEAGKDTILVFGSRINGARWRTLYKECINLEIASAHMKEGKYASFKLNKPLSSLAQNKESHKFLPITVGGGIMLNGNDISYFGQFRASAKFGEHYLRFDYKSKDYGPLAYTYQQNQFNFSYTYKSFQLAAGLIPGPRNFLTIGQGVSVRYENVTKYKGFYISALKHNENAGINAYMSDNIYGGLHYQIKKLSVNHLVETNFDKFYHINSYLLSNEVIIFKRSDLHLKMFGGIGFEQDATDRAMPQLSDVTKGYAGGYAFSWTGKHLQVSSTVQYNSPEYAGMYKGIYSHNHMVGYFKNHFLYSLNYYSNVTTRNTLRDTLFNSDYLQVNSVKYGAGISYQKGQIGGAIGAGIITQTGSFNYIDNGNYADGNLRIMFNRYNNLTLNSQNAFQQQRFGSPIFITNSGIRFNTKIFSVSGIYNRTPGPEENMLITHYFETIRGGPSVNFVFFNQTLTGSIRYDISKTLSEKTIRNGIGAQMSFRSMKGAVNLAFNGFFPLRDPTTINIPVSETRYASLTLHKQINIPIHKYDLHNLKGVLFKDDNNNGRLDQNEEVIPNALIRIDDNTLISNSDGEFEYRNMTSGVYTVSLFDIKIGNLVPVNGFVQSIDVTEDRKLAIAFKKGRKIQGNIKIDRDTLSAITITAEKFKVNIADSTGRSYTTISDANGDYYAYVPEGMYNVSISADYFTGTDFKLETPSFTENMYTKEETFVQFVIQQKRRVVRFVDLDKK